MILGPMGRCCGDDDDGDVVDQFQDESHHENGR